MEELLLEGKKVTGIKPISISHTEAWNGGEEIDFLRETGSTGQTKQQMNSAVGKVSWVR